MNQLLAEASISATMLTETSRDEQIPLALNSPQCSPKQQQRRYQEQILSGLDLLKSKVAELRLCLLQQERQIPSNNESSSGKKEDRESDQMSDRLVARDAQPCHGDTRSSPDELQKLPALSQADSAPLNGQSAEQKQLNQETTENRIETPQRQDQQTSNNNPGSSGPDENAEYYKKLAVETVNSTVDIQAEYVSQLNTLIEVNSKLRAQCEDDQTKQYQLSELASQYHAQYVSEQQFRRSLEEESKALTEQVTKYQDLLHSVQSELLQKNELVSQKEAQLQEQASRITQLQQDSEELQISNQEIQAELQKQKTAAKEDSDKATSELRQKLQAQTNKSITLFSQLEALQEQYQAEAKKYQKQVADLQTKLACAIQDNQTLIQTSQRAETRHVQQMQQLRIQLLEQARASDELRYELGEVLTQSLGNEHAPNSARLQSQITSLQNSVTGRQLAETSWRNTLLEQTLKCSTVQQEYAVRKLNSALANTGDPRVQTLQVAFRRAQCSGTSARLRELLDQGNYEQSLKLIEKIIFE